MGNQQVKIGLRLDKESFEAGSVITGRVYLSLPNSNNNNSSKNNNSSPRKKNHRITGLHLLLEGQEYAQITTTRPPSRKHHHNGHSNPHEPVVERSSHTLVRQDFPLVRIGAQQQGQYEYPFELPVPPELPTSMTCHDKKSNKNYCQVRYTLTAYLVMTMMMSDHHDGSSGGGIPTATHHVSSVPVGIAACTRSRHDDRPLVMQADVFPVTTCCFWNKGSIQLGWQADRSHVAPGDYVQIEAVGENRSKLDVDSITVKWVETTTWKTTGSSSTSDQPGQGPETHRRTVKRTVAEQTVAVNRLTAWVPRDIERLVPGDSLHSPEPVRFSLHLPPDARDTYHGPAVQVRHMFIVQVNTAGGVTTTSPESACQVHVHRKSSSTQQPQSSTASSPPVVATIVDVPPEQSPTATTFTDNTEHIVHAQALPADWNPVQADVVVIPEAAAVLIDEEVALLPGHAHSYLATAPSERDLLSSSTTTMNILHHSTNQRQQQPTMAAIPSQQATAPSESSLLDQRTIPRTSSTLDSTMRNQAIQQLRTLIADTPENLSVVLTDPAWTAVVKDLDPREYCALVSAATPKSAATVAQTLATTMGCHFQCRHVICCLWSLSDEVRMPVACAVGKLAVDVAQNQSRMEQALQGHELDQFRRAMSM